MIVVWAIIFRARTFERGLTITTYSELEISNWDSPNF